MPDITLTERAFTFTFLGVQYAEKYDTWAHYRKQFQSACGGSKAVDFIVVVPVVLWLIEAKDYRQHPRTKPTELADEVAQKVKDTMAGLVSAQVNGKNPDEASAAKAALECEKIRVGLHLELPESASKLFPTAIDPAALLMKLRSRVRFADPDPKVFDSNSIPPGLPLAIADQP